MVESRLDRPYPEWTTSVYGVRPAVAEPGVLNTGYKEDTIMPAAIWAAGTLYSAYYTGEVLRVFDLVDVLLSCWVSGRLDIPAGNATRALERIYRKSARRVSVTARVQLYRRVFQFGTLETAEAPSYTPAHVSFSAAWERLMRGAAACAWHRSLGENERAEIAQTQILQATRELQRGLSAAMAGSSYLMATEVATLLRESLDLLGGPEIVERFGVPGQGAGSVIERMTAELFALTLPVARVHALGWAGAQVLQDWVAAYNGPSTAEEHLRRLLKPAGEWNAAWAALSIEGGLPGRVS